jgi:hypothetical protein
MVILAVSCRGLEHRATGGPRQDAFALSHRLGQSGMAEMVAVVCDGVGKFKRSDEAASIVSRRLTEMGSKGVTWATAFAQANEDLRWAADESLAADPADGMATTAVAVSVGRQADDWVGEAAWVGDSTLWHLSPSGSWTLITAPSDSEPEPFYHTAEVIPLPSADGACTSVPFQVSQGALFVMSDGVSNPMRWSSDVQRVLAEWWSRPPDIFTFAAQVGFARKSHMDDRTVIGIWPHGQT